MTMMTFPTRLRYSRASTWIAAAVTIAIPLTACGSSTESVTDDSPAATETSIIIEHAYGQTELPAQPERVVTLGWGTTDAALALGVTPVAIPIASGVGEDDNGLLPWVNEYLEENDIAVPDLMSDMYDPQYEEILSQDPDLILATEAGLTEEQYARLTEIAPTVVHPGEAWATPWREVFEISGAALGKPDEAAEILEDLDTLTLGAAEEHPEFGDYSISVLASSDDGGLIVFTEGDPRAQLLEQLGFTVDSYGETSSGFQLSGEEAGTITSDVVLIYYGSEDERQEFESGPVAALLPQFEQGRVASVVGAANRAAVSPPTALSWPWTIDSFVQALSEATRTGN